ncbi:hypothetical protein AAIB41_02430 [Brucella sp. BE17]|uniref:hypothetical protein n=1 Tax=Brucella sp. BE17 TaxID=3142977 RepID=UPI0031B9CAEB
MKKLTTVPLVLAAACFGATSAFADISGEHSSSGTCSNSNSTQCWLEIKKSATGYRVKHVVADRQDGRKILCATSFSVEPHVSTIHGQKSYLGKLNGDSVFIRAFDHGRIDLYPGAKTKVICGKYSFMGSYSEIGD